MQSHREILRGDDAKPIGLKDDDDDYASATAEGGLLDILLEDPPSDEVRKLARATVAVAGQRMMRTLGIVEVPIGSSDQHSQPPHVRRWNTCSNTIPI